jgi:hypothetical protein
MERKGSEFLPFLVGPIWPARLHSRFAPGMVLGLAAGFLALLAELGGTRRPEGALRSSGPG